MLKILPANQTMKAAQELKNSGWRQIIICYVLYAAVMSGSMILFDRIMRMDQIFAMLIAQSIAAVVSVSFMLTIGRRTSASLGMGLNGFFKQYGAGWLIAAVSLFAVWLVNVSFQAVSTAFNPDVNVLFLGLMLVGFIFQGFMEEFLLRGLIMTQVAVKFGVIAGILANSLLFALGHLGNSGASLISVVSTFLIGLVFSLQFYYHDNIWLVSGFHSGWNFILGPVLGIAVSGFRLPTSLLATRTAPAMAALNGGGYGFEAGYPAIVLSLAIIAVYVRLILKRKRAENL